MTNILDPVIRKVLDRLTDSLCFAASLKAVCFFVSVALVSPLKAQESEAEVIYAAFASALTVDGNAADWANLSSGVVTMDTSIRGANGTLVVDIRYAWDDANVYILVQENSNGDLSTNAQEAPDGDAYLKEFWLFDCIAFWIDLDNTSGTEVDGSIVAAGNADFQPWFGFSSSGRTDLIYGRANNTGAQNLDGLENGKVATGGTFAAHNRTIEVAIAWADIAATVDPDRQPEGDLKGAIAPGYIFGSDPLLLNNDYEGQAFIGPKQYEAPSGTDSDSRDILLVAPEIVIHSSHASGAGFSFDWNSTVGNMYQVERRDALNIPWQIIADGYPEGGATADNTSFTDADLSRAAIYRVAQLEAPPLFFNDFESGLSGWKATDYGDSGTEWELGKPTNGPSEAHSGTNVFGTGLSADYTDDTDVYLLSPVIDLTGVDKARLEFWSFRDIEALIDGEATDYAEVAILDETGEEYLTDLPIWTRGGASTQWRKERASIPAEALGRKIRLEFHFYADFTNDDGPQAGWFIDDVAITTK